MKKLSVLVWFFLLPLYLLAQKSELTALFSDVKPLDTKLKVSIKDIKKKTNDSTYLPAVLYTKNASGGWDSMKISVRARGIFRRENCYFPPIRVKINKADAKGTLYEGNKSLKLVMPCMNNDDKNTLIMKEFECYKMEEKVTPYYFNTRLANMEFTEVDGKKNKTQQILTFFIEDDDLVADRHHAKVLENQNLHPLTLNDTAALRHDFFQMMVANTDWSTTFLHNAKVILVEPRKYIPLAYDFDMAGFVNPRYAQVNPELGISNVRERLYRGFCRKEPVVQYVRQQFIAAESAVMGVVDGNQGSFAPKEYADQKKYMGEFFTMLKDDGQFKRAILDGCRKK